MQLEDELRTAAPLVPHVDGRPATGDADVETLRRELRALRTRLDRVEATLADRPYDETTDQRPR